MPNTTDVNPPARKYPSDRDPRIEARIWEHERLRAEYHRLALIDHPTEEEVRLRREVDEQIRLGAPWPGDD